MTFNEINIFIHVFSTSLKFFKNIKVTKFLKIFLKKFFFLSKETIVFLMCYLFLDYILFCKYDYFILLFNTFIHIYKQELNFYIFYSFILFICVFSFINFYNLNSLEIYFFYNFYLSIILLDILEHNMYSELGSRANSMKNSISNAKENISYFTLIYNGFRKSRITNEIIEILSSIEALS